jgi:hypothetical protein
MEMVITLFLNKGDKLTSLLAKFYLREQGGL